MDVSLLAQNRYRVLIGSAGVAALFCMLRPRRRSAKDPPSPGWFWVMKNMPGKSLFIQLLQYCRSCEAKAVTLWMGPQRTVVAVHPDTCREILRSPETFPKDPDALVSKLLAPLFAGSMAFSNGAVHQRQRKLLNHPFDPQGLKCVFRHFLSCTDELFALWHPLSGEPFNAAPWITKFALDVLGRAVFDMDFGAMQGKTGELYAAYENLLDEVNNPIRGIPLYEYLPLEANRKVLKSRQVVFDAFDKMIKNGRERLKQQGNKFGNLLDQLLLMCDADGSSLSHNELMTNMWVMLIAGHDTTATSVQHLLWYLSQDQERQERARQEVLQAFGGRTPTFEDVSGTPPAKLKFMDAMLFETLRLEAPVWNVPTRICAETTTLGGYHVARGTSVWMGVGCVGRNSQVWDHVDDFYPERWLGSSERKDPYEFLPFSLGPKNCLGRLFSLTEQRVFICELLQKFRVLPVEKERVRFQGVVSASLNGLREVWIRIEPRAS